MDKKKTELIITVVLVVILVLVFTNNFKKVRGRIAPAKPQPSNEIKMPQQMLPTLPPKEEVIDEAMELDTSERDPFQLHGMTHQAVDTIASLRLMGITISRNNKPKAIINDEMVSVDSKIGKFTIVEILSNKVIVSDGRNTYELEMK